MAPSFLGDEDETPSSETLFLPQQLSMPPEELAPVLPALFLEIMCPPQSPNPSGPGDVLLLTHNHCLCQRLALGSGQEEVTLASTQEPEQALPTGASLTDLG